MEKFIETCIVIILILLVYIVFRNEKFIGTFSQVLEAKNFNFKNDPSGYSGADRYLATLLSK